MIEKHAPGHHAAIERTRVAVMVDGTTVPAWVHTVLSRLDRDPSLDWRLTFVGDDARAERRARSGALGFRAFDTFDAWRHPRPADALAGRDATALLAGRERVELGAIPGPTSTPLREPRGAGTAELLDVVLDLRAVPDPALPVEVPRFGVWRAQPAVDRRAGDAVFWAIHDRRPVCEVQLLARGSESAEPVVAATAAVGVQPASLAVSRSLCYWRAAGLLVQELSDLRVPACLDVRGSTSVPVRGRTPRRRGPGVGAVLQVAGRQLGASMRHRSAARRTREQWLLGLRVRDTDEPSLDGVGFRPLVPPSDRTFADPFLLDHGSTTYLFLEELEFTRARGVISVATVTADGGVGTPEVVLERPYHLSYPFVFRDGPDVFMIPESAANRTVELYRAIEFPRRWELDVVLLEDVRALDTSLFHDGERYWLFTSIEEPGRNRNDELHLYRSTSLRGPWVAHPRNPVVTDVRCARPAGRPFLMDGSLIRPAQDCSSRYGASIAFQRVDVLSEDAYSEHTVSVLGPTWARELDATHTFNSVGRIDVVDGARRVRRARGR